VAGDVAVSNLTDFVTESRTKSDTWVESTVPSEVRQQILDHPEHGSRMVARWLRSLGYSEATDGKVAYFRNRRGS